LWPIKGQLALALIGLAIGGLMGLMQALDRVGIVIYKAMLMQTYYQGLTIHGVLLAFLFTFAFSNAFVSLVAIRGFERPLASTFLAQGAFWTMLAGTLLAAYAILTNQATVLFTFYAPMRASSLFFLGAALLVISTLLTALNLVLTRRAWQREHPGERTPLLGFVGVVTYVMWGARLARCSGARRVLPATVVARLAQNDRSTVQPNIVLVYWACDRLFLAHAGVYFVVSHGSSAGWWSRLQR
jgi:cytochrome c oxidase subunit 1